MGAEDKGGMRLGQSEGEPGLWDVTRPKDTLYFAFSPARRDALLAAEDRLATLTRERDEAVKDLTDVRWAFKCSVDAHEATRADLASARTALAEAREYVAAKFDPEARRVLARIDALVEPAP